MSRDIEVEEVSAELEREAVIALIMSDRAISVTRKFVEPSLFSSFVSKNIAQWCCEFYDKFGKSPKLHIKDLYEQNKEKVDDTTSDLIAEALSDISDQYASLDTYNEDFAVSMLVKYLNLARVQLLMDEVGEYLDKKDDSKIEELISQYSPVRVNSNPSVDSFDLLDLASERLEQPPLLSLPGAFGQLIGPISRSSFTAILSPEKRGKSQFMMYIANYAAKKKRRVLFVSAGDMTLEELSERSRLMATGMNQKLLEKTIVYKPCLDCKAAQDGSCIEHDFDKINRSLDNSSPEELLTINPDHIPCTECRKNEDPAIRKQFKPTVWWNAVEMLPVSKAVMAKAIEEYKVQFRKACGKNGGVFYQFFPTKTCNPEMIEELLKDYQKAGTPIDVLVVDYMDILDAPARARSMDERNKINATWEEMRRISQTYNLALITATQGSRVMYKSDADQGSPSEDKRKASHVTLMFALNQKPEEKEQGIIRVNILFKRDGEANMMQEAVILNCFALGKVHISSYLTRKSMAESLKPKVKDNKGRFRK